MKTALFLLVACLLLAGCLGGVSSTPTPAPAGEVTMETPTPVPVAEATATPTPAAGDSGSRTPTPVSNVTSSATPTPDLTPTPTPEPILEYCNDSDGGIDFSVEGTVTVFNGNKTEVAEVCDSVDNLVEYYCNDKAVMHTNTACSYGCNKGKCNDAESSVKMQPGESIQLDGIMVKLTAISPPGTVDNTDPIATFAVSQYNIPLDTFSVGRQTPHYTKLGIFIAFLEVTNAYVRVIAYGTATPTPAPIYRCVDTDGGENFFKKGFIEIYGSTQQEAVSSNDYCINDEMLRETSCSAESATTRQLAIFKDINCSALNATPDGTKYKCLEGACVLTTP